MEEQTNEIPESVSLVNAVNEATRGPRFGIFEQVLCTHIYLAANTPEPLKKIQHIADASLMLELDKQKSLCIDAEKVSIIKTVCNALSLSVKTRIPNGASAIVSVKFGVEPSKENFDKYLSPWYTSGFYYNPEWLPSDLRCRVFLCSYCNSEIANSEEGKINVTHSFSTDSCGSCGRTLSGERDYKIKYRKAKDVSQIEFKFGIFTALSELGYIAALNAFLQWSDLFILETMRKLTDAVKPEIYNEVIRLYAAQKEEQKHVS
jgi:hypothetical protein